MYHHKPVHSHYANVSDTVLISWYAPSTELKCLQFATATVMIRCHIVTSTLFILNVINSYREHCQNAFVINTLLIRYLFVRSSSRCDQNFVWRMLPYCNRTATVLRTNITYELLSVYEPSAYWPFVGISRKNFCMHKNLRRTVRTTTYASVLRRTENEPKPMS